MANALGMAVVDIVTKKFGEHTTALIIHQCRELGIDYENMKKEDLVPLAKNLRNLFSVVFGEVIADNISQEIVALAEKEFVAT